jgi:hypothetical protein
MVTYQSLLKIDGSENTDLVRRNDGVFVLLDSSAQDPDAVAYREWVAQGNVPDHYVAPPSPVPQTISDRQFFQQLAVDSIITEDQALASNAAVIPAPLLAIIEAMPAEQQFAAKMLVSGATVFERTHPMTEAIGATYGWTSGQIDAFFRAASVL